MTSIFLCSLGKLHKYSCVTFSRLYCISRLENEEVINRFRKFFFYLNAIPFDAEFEEKFSLKVNSKE